jgi:RES domain-containing protein
MLELGARWYAAGTTVALLVPSVIVIEERNLLLNPGHRDFAEVQAHQPRVRLVWTPACSTAIS